MYFVLLIFVHLPFSPSSPFLFFFGLQTEK